MNAATSSHFGARLPGYGIVLIAFAAGVASLLVMRTPGPVATFVAVVIVSAWFVHDDQHATWRL